MYLMMVIVFVIGYAAIALEHNIHVDKAASALLTGVITWTIFVLGASDVLNLDMTLSINEILAGGGDLLKSFREYFTNEVLHESTEKLGVAAETPSMVNHFIVHELEHHLIEIGSILFFLIGAMTIVEVIDAHEGFAVITDRIKTAKKVPLLWILSTITFFFSAALDNLTTAIVMAALLKKLIRDKEDLWTFAGVIIIAANAGGAWSPIGDVTTIMLWIGGQITAGAVVTNVIVPSMVCLIVPLIVLTFTQKGEVMRPEAVAGGHTVHTTPGERNLVFFLGVACLLFVPIFKTITHLPPFMGILLGLGVMWTLTEVLHGKKDTETQTELKVVGVLRRVDVPSVLFFLGILVAVGSLSSAGHLIELARGLETAIGDIYVINIIIGALSSIVDNVPLVAGAMGMYEIGPEVAGVAYPQDHTFWEFLAYCAGTGGSCLIIGSAAGVAIMGILKIDFFWYIKKISLLALLGYLAGAGTYIALNSL